MLPGPLFPGAGEPQLSGKGWERKPANAPIACESALSATRVSNAGVNALPGLDANSHKYFIT